MQISYKTNEVRIYNPILIKFLFNVWGSVMVTFQAHNLKTVNACVGSNPTPAPYRNQNCEKVLTVMYLIIHYSPGFQIGEVYRWVVF